MKFARSPAAANAQPSTFSTVCDIVRTILPLFPLLQIIHISNWRMYNRGKCLFFAIQVDNVSFMNET
jgi:hypothetical protein